MKFLIIFLPLIVSTIIYSQKNDSLVGGFHAKSNKDYSIFKNTVSKKYFLREENGKTKLTNYNYISNLSNQYLQCLDASNKLVYLDLNLKKVSKPKITNWVCGELGNDNYVYEIIKNKSFFLISEKIISYTKNTETTKIIDSVNSDGIINIYFLNKKRKLEGDIDSSTAGIFYSPSTTVIAEKNNQIGILKKGLITFYDSIDIRNNILKAKQNDRFWFLGSKKYEKYKFLENFNFNLAKFTNEDEENGYLDILGNEYFD